MFRTYKYRLYPNKTQERALYDLLYAARQLYNHALAHRRKRWEESRHTVTFHEQSALLTQWRNEDPEENPLHRLNASTGEQILHRLDSAYRQFLKGKRGRPRFKRANQFTSLPFRFGNGARLHDGRLYVQSIGMVKVRWHRELTNGKVKRVIVTGRNGKWHALIEMEIPDPAPAPHPGPAVGIDVGLHHALALSDDWVIDSPQYLKQSLKNLRVAQRRVARRKKDSQRRKNAVRQLAKQHERVANQRRDFWHKVTRALVNTYGLIALEDLSLSFMLRNDTLARAAHDVGLGMFHELLAYKAIEAGCEIVMVNPRNTSQACSGCGGLVAKDLSVRVHECPECLLTLDRDVNAARNILALMGDP